MLTPCHSSDSPEQTLAEDRGSSMYQLIALLLIAAAINTCTSKIVNEVDLRLIDLYKKQYGEDSIVKVYHRNKKHYATKQPLVHYEILVVAEAFYGTTMVNRMLEVREMAINNVPIIPGSHNVFTVYVPTFEEWRVENHKDFEEKEADQLQVDGE